MEKPQYEALKRYADELGCVCLEKEPMSVHTSFQIGGPADLFIEPSSREMLSSFLEACHRWEIPVLIMGNGSNLLVSDTGIRGAVLHISGLSHIRINGFEIDCEAGVKMSRLCQFACDNSLSGLEFAWGIPGTAGGAAYMNAGAYGGELKDVLVSCEHVTKDGQIGEMPAADMQLGYRKSAYQTNGCAVTSVKIRLQPGDPIFIQETMDELMRRRMEKQPYDMPSAGSVFKRPAGHFTGPLIEQCGLKGLQVGGARVSDKHAGFIVNMGGATCSDVRILIETIQQEVFLQTGIKLECEIRLIES